MRAWELMMLYEYILRRAGVLWGFGDEERVQPNKGNKMRVMISYPPRAIFIHPFYRTNPEQFPKQIPLCLSQVLKALEPTSHDN